MKATLFHRFTLLLVSVLILGACEGPEGPEGPQGPQGPAGAQGPAGPQGPQGNANVVTYRVSVALSDYGGGTEANIPVPAITEDIFNNGTVLVYLLYSEGWRPLPFTFSNTSYTNSMLYFYRTGFVTLRIVSTSSTPATYAYAGSYKIVVISGRPGKTEEPVDYSDYEAVKAYYGLSEADEVELFPLAPASLDKAGAR